MESLDHDYGKIYDRHAAEVDLKDFLENNPINVIMMPEQAISTGKGKLFNEFLGLSYARQRHAIQQEQSRLEIIKARTGRPVDEICNHSIRDEFHTKDSADYRCLLCEKRGSLSENWRFRDA